jgi:hypothetical protein
MYLGIARNRSCTSYECLCGGGFNFTKSLDVLLDAGSLYCGWSSSSQSQDHKNAGQVQSVFGEACAQAGYVHDNSTCNDPTGVASDGRGEL